jgi:Arc/MetJ family transcription regulator
VAKEISKQDKTSMVIDRAKAEKVRKALGTTTLAATVDAAFDEVLRLEAHRRLMDRIRRDGGIGPPPDEVRRLRTRRTGSVSR